jgi:HAD superfamily hydrolase (TIGR01509 family)
MISAIIFDLDGLLMDTEPLWFQARVELFKGFGLVWREADQERCMGLSTAAWAGIMVERLDGRLTVGTVIEEMLKRMGSHYRNGEVKILPGAEEAILYSSERATLGLASGSPRRLINAALQGAKWTSYFKEVLSSDDVPSGKPSPDVYLEIMRRLHVQSEESVIVEDSNNGILAGLAARVRVVAVPNRHMRPTEEVLNRAAAIIESLAFLPAALQQIESDENLEKW